MQVAYLMVMLSIAVTGKYAAMEPALTLKATSNCNVHIQNMCATMPKCYPLFIHLGVKRSDIKLVGMQSQTEGTHFSQKNSQKAGLNSTVKASVSRPPTTRICTYMVLMSTPNSITDAPMPLMPISTSSVLIV